MGRTVLIVDDHPAFRSAARALLEAAGFEVVGDAVDGESAVAAAQALRPAIVILDVQLPDLDGFLVADRLVAEIEDPPAVVLTSSRSVASLRWRLECSAWCFIPKSELSGEALAAAVPG
jgi:DNA-binding NarL/FixJ family response regulator